MQTESGQSPFDKYLVSGLRQRSEENCRSSSQGSVKKSVARAQERKRQKPEPA
jgi:hypothetical protein